MKNINHRIYGTSPISIAVIHGGPGAPGELASLAQILSENYGVLEPFQSEKTVEGQVNELANQLIEYADSPVNLIGFSWGAWLSYLLAARHSNLVNRLVLVGCGPLESRYAHEILPTRLSRLNKSEKEELHALFDKMKNASQVKEAFYRFEALFAKTDAFDPIEHNFNVLEIQTDVYQNVWPEASNMRKSGELLALGRQIQCPVIAIHGDYDPHPFEGVRKPLSLVIEDFTFYLLENCGHRPWIEREARDDFFNILYEELA